MLYGSPYFKPVSGLKLIDQRSAKLNLGLTGSNKAKRGTLVSYDANDSQVILSSAGKAFVGFLPQDVNIEGLTPLNILFTKNPDYPLRDTIDMSGVWVPSIGELFEFEGLGADFADEGNLVVTSGDGAIASNAAKGTQLSTHLGALRIVQDGDVPLFELISAALTPEVDGNRRILVAYTGAGTPYVAPA